MMTVYPDDYNEGEKSRSAQLLSKNVDKLASFLFGTKKKKKLGIFICQILSVWRRQQHF